MNYKTKSILKRTLVALSLGIVLFNACKKSDSSSDSPSPSASLDCSKVTGATFTTSSGTMASLLSTKCGSGSSCHGSGSLNDWAYSGNYDDLKSHFSHMYTHTINDKKMPPSGSPQLTQEEIDRFECWQRAGFPK